ncbi:MAG TPA: VCBS repeat-containing protein [Vicinamibacterales bacterium]|nr:VCBS repeat-containing protein [Vicinamibacterales bacterium]
MIHRSIGPLIWGLAGVLALAVVVGGRAAESQAPPALSRAVAPFPVADESGRPFDIPFLGGLDVPRPQFVDIDADGDNDLFMQEFRNEVWFFENTGSAKAPKFEWRTNRYQNLDVGEWCRFVDLDADGDFDLLAEQPFSNIRFYRNVGTRQAARFESGGTLVDTDGQNVYLDRQNLPAIVDIDCDQRLDLFIGRIEGLVIHYEAEAPGSLRFAFLTDHWENIEIIGRGGVRPGSDHIGESPKWSDPGLTPSTPSTIPFARHGANALSFADFDGDKDLDLLWGDFFEPGVLLIQNIGATCSTPSFQTEPVALPFADTRTSGYNAPVPVDFDFDGDIDFFMGVIGGANNPVTTAADNFYYYERTAKDHLELRTKRFLNGIDLGSETVPAAGDIDGDGDLDLLVGSKIDMSGDAGRLTVFRNVGTKAAPSFRQEAPLKLVDDFHLAPTLGDLDGDGDLDLLVGTWNKDIRYFRNQGTSRQPTWVEDPALTIKPPRTSLASPLLADADGDGDLDLLIGTATGAIVFYRNDGTPKNAKFTMATERLGDLSPGRRSRPAFADFTGDGIPDLLVGRESGGAALYRNAGTLRAPRFIEDASISLALPPISTPLAVDLDGDGRIELVAGAAGGGLIYHR